MQFVKNFYKFEYLTSQGQTLVTGFIINLIISAISITIALLSNPSSGFITYATGITAFTLAFGLTLSDGLNWISIHAQEYQENRRSIGFSQLFLIVMFAFMFFIKDLSIANIFIAIIIVVLLPVWASFVLKFHAKKSYEAEVSKRLKIELHANYAEFQELCPILKGQYDELVETASNSNDFNVIQTTHSSILSYLNAEKKIREVKSALEALKS
jgi:hypothetical protein